MGRPKLKLPPIPAPVALPTVDEGVEDEAIEKVRRRSGFERTLSTGALARKRKKSILGGTYGR